MVQRPTLNFRNASIFYFVPTGGGGGGGNTLVLHNVLQRAATEMFRQNPWIHDTAFSRQRHDVRSSFGYEHSSQMTAMNDYTKE